MSDREGKLSRRLFLRRTAAFGAVADSRRAFHRCITETVEDLRKELGAPEDPELAARVGLAPETVFDAAPIGSVKSTITAATVWRWSDLWIAVAGRSTVRERFRQCGEVRICQLHVERAERLRQALTPPRANQRHDVVALRRHPGNRDLRRRRADLIGNRAQCIHQREILVEIFALEARAVAAEIFRIGAVLRPVTADKAA